MSYTREKNVRCAPFIRLNGRIHVNIGPLKVPCDRAGNPLHSPKFAQIYMYDPDTACSLRMKNLRDQTTVDPKLVKKLTKMFHKYSYTAKQFKTMKEIMDEAEKKGEELRNFCMVLKAPTQEDVDREQLHAGRITLRNTILILHNSFTASYLE